MIDNAKIKTFVQKKLGCGCQDEVFQAIGCQRNVRLSGELTIDIAITVGNRLLIYVLEKEIAGLDEGLLSFLVSEGRKERDLRGLNRLRLVIVTDETAEKELLLGIFNGLQDNDERVHLHVIRKADDCFPYAD